MVQAILFDLFGTLIPAGSQGARDATSHRSASELAVEESEQLLASVLAESFARHGEKSTRPVEGIVLMAAVSEDLVLNATTALVDLLVGELHYMKRVRDLAGPGQRLVEDLGVGAGEVERGVGNVEAPQARALLQPGNRLVAVATRNDVEQLTVSHVHDRGSEPLAAVVALAHEERLVDARSIRSVTSATAIL